MEHRVVGDPIWLLPTQPLSGYTFYKVPADQVSLPLGQLNPGPVYVTFIALTEKGNQYPLMAQAPTEMYVIRDANGELQQVTCSAIVAYNGAPPAPQAPDGIVISCVMAQQQSAS